ncbi:MAG: plastocyanin/azurin family copper-binding protein [Pseudomonadota bacterium]
MKLTRREHLKLLGGAAAAAAVPAVLMAESHADAEGPVTHEVLMLNQDPDNPRERQVFSPPVLRAKVGDTIKFISEDRGHNAQTDDKWIPEGGTEWKGRINDDVEVVVEVEGAYGYLCQPHASAGMVGLVLVGDVSGNYEDLKGQRFRGRAKQRMETYFEMADAMLAEEAEMATES